LAASFLAKTDVFPFDRLLYLHLPTRYLARAMSPSEYQIRRATVDDLPALKQLWEYARLPALELERRFTEFQLAATPDGKIAGAVGLHIERQQGEIHSEAYAEPESEETLRPLLWDRVLMVAKNHGLLRLWALATTNFLREKGMTEAEPALLAKLPVSFGHPQAGWLTLKLKEEVASTTVMEQEFAILAQAQREETERLLERAKFIRVLVYVLLGIGVAVLAVVGIKVFRTLPKLRNPGR
jgi:N-acetylglutamate synthase-like GNAT family acetyltransferase